MTTKKFNFYFVYQMVHSPSFEESNVKDGAVEVDELKEEHLDCEGVFVFRKGAMSLCRNKHFIHNISFHSPLFPTKIRQEQRNLLIDLKRKRNIRVSCLR
jgi:hypothetical protein